MSKGWLYIHPVEGTKIPVLRLEAKIGNTWEGYLLQKETEEAYTIRHNQFTQAVAVEEFIKDPPRLELEMDPHSFPITIRPTINVDPLTSAVERWDAVFHRLTELRDAFERRDTDMAVGVKAHTHRCPACQKGWPCQMRACAKTSKVSDMREQPKCPWCQSIKVECPNLDTPTTMITTQPINKETAMSDQIKSDSTTPNNPPSTTPKSRFEQIWEEAIQPLLGEVGLRVARSQITKAIQEPLEAWLLSDIDRNDPEQMKKVKAKLSKFFSSPMGKGFIQLGVGGLLSLVPGSERKVGEMCDVGGTPRDIYEFKPSPVASLAREFRVEGASEVGFTIASILTDPLLRMIKSGMIPKPDVAALEDLSKLRENVEEITKVYAEVKG